MTQFIDIYWYFEDGIQNREKASDTTLSKYVWELKDK